MKTLRKYTSIAFLLFSVATVVPTYANPTIDKQEQGKQEETTVESQNTHEYKKPTMRQRVYEGLQVTLITGVVAAMYACLIYTILKDLGYITGKQDPFNIRSINANIEVKKLFQNYKDLLQMSEATVWELPATHKSDFLKTVTAVYNKYGIKSTSGLYTLVDGSLLLNTNISLKN